MILTVINSHRKCKARARRQRGEGVTPLNSALGLRGWPGRAARAPSWRPHTGDATPLLGASGGVRRAGPCPERLPPQGDSTCRLELAIWQHPRAAARPVCAQPVPQNWRRRRGLAGGSWQRGDHMLARLGLGVAGCGWEPCRGAVPVTGTLRPWPPAAGATHGSPKGSAGTGGPG